jgi:hypothetical protein
VVECLLIKNETLSSNPSTVKKKKIEYSFSLVGSLDNDYLFCNQHRNKDI